MVVCIFVSSANYNLMKTFAITTTSRSHVAANANFGFKALQELSMIVLSTYRIKL